MSPASRTPLVALAAVVMMIGGPAASGGPVAGCVAATDSEFGGSGANDRWVGCEAGVNEEETTSVRIVCPTEARSACHTAIIQAWGLASDISWRAGDAGILCTRTWSNDGEINRQKNFCGVGHPAFGEAGFWVTHDREGVYPRRRAVGVGMNDPAPDEGDD